MRIALAQVDCDLGDVDANVARAALAIGAAKDAQADVVVFPELHLSGYGLGSVAEDVSLEVSDDRIHRLAQIADPMGVLLCFPESSPSWLHTYNSAAYL
jgi:predicted amidohydrolase